MIFACPRMTAYFGLIYGVSRATPYIHSSDFVDPAMLVSYLFTTSVASLWYLPGNMCGENVVTRVNYWRWKLFFVCTENRMHRHGHKHIILLLRLCDTLVSNARSCEAKSNQYEKVGWAGIISNKSNTKPRSSSEYIILALPYWPAYSQNAHEIFVYKYLKSLDTIVLDTIVFNIQLLYITDGHHFWRVD